MTVQHHRRASVAFLLASAAMIGISACGGPPPLPTSVTSNTPVSIATDISASATATPTDLSRNTSEPESFSGSLETALTRLYDSTSFHFIYTITTSGTAKVEGDALGLKGNYHYTTVPDPKRSLVSIVGGEWLVIRNGGKADRYLKQNGKWILASSGAPDLSYIWIAYFVTNDYTNMTAVPQEWQSLGSDNVGGQTADHYVTTIVNWGQEEVWVSQRSGDVIQLQETNNTAVSVIMFSNIDQPVTLPSPS